MTRCKQIVVNGQLNCINTTNHFQRKNNALLLTKVSVACKSQKNEQYHLHGVIFIYSHKFFDGIPIVGMWNSGIVMKVKTITQH